MTTTTMFHAAKQYLTRGWSVIPLQPRDKRPLFSWKEFQTRLATEAELWDWFGETDNNIGIVAGQLSDLTIVDCDSAEAIMFFETQTVERGGDPTTYQVQTAHGMHYYYRFVEGSSNFQARKEWPGLDLRSEGGYVVAPPSIHPSGVVYTLGSGLFPVGGDLAVAPGWLFEKTIKPLAPSGGLPSEDLFAPCEVGSRNMALTRLAGSLLLDLPFGKALKMCQVWNRTNPEPLPDDELLRTVQSVAKKEESKGPQPKPIIHRFGDLTAKVQALRITGIPRGVSSGWPTLDDHYRIPLGQWTLLTGMPGAGKSTFISHLMLNLMENEGWHFVVFSGENIPYEHFAARLIATYLKKPFTHGTHERLTREETDAGMAFLDAHCRYVDAGDETLTIAEILAAAGHVKEEWDFQGLIIDPWNECNHFIDARQTETNVFGEELSAIRKFARLHTLHAFVVAHPRTLQKGKDGEYAVPTPYDVSGSANFRNKADFCLAVHRNFGVSRDTEIHIQKVRHAENGTIGMVTLGFDTVTGRYYDVE